MAEASVVFTAEMDDKKAQAELKRLDNQIRRLGDALKDATADRSPLAAEAERLGAALEDANRKLYEMKDAGVGRYTAEQIAEQTEQVKFLTAQHNAADAALKRQDDTIARTTTKMERLQEKAGELRQSLAGVKEASGAFDGITTSAKKLEKRIIGLAKRVFVFTLITKALRGVREYFAKAVMANKDAAKAVKNLKGALQTLAQPIVNAVIPAFTALVNLLARAVSMVAAFVSILFGTTAQDSAAAAKALNGESKAINGVGGAAKKAAKSLASFDEINQLAQDTAGGGGGTASLFDTVGNYQLPKWMEDLATALSFEISDVLFKWDNLTGESIAKKIIAGLSALAGGVAGFMIGGVPGAIIGTLLGCALGLVFDNLTFDNDGKISKHELYTMIAATAGAIAGGAVGFAVGGPAGAAIGALLGAGIVFAISEIAFENDGETPSSIVKTLVVTLGAMAGGLIGFAVGGPAGAVIGAAIGTGVGLYLKKALFENGGAAKKDFLETLIEVVTVIGGGLIGFALGGPVGAAIGATIGAVLSIPFKEAKFADGTAKSGKQRFMESLRTALTVAAGGLIGFALGGPAGAVLGAAIGVGVTLFAKSVDWSGDSKAKIDRAANGAFNTNGRSGSFGGRAKVPALAQGAVIPPNRSFMAVLGDQTSGNNIEAPESLLRQMAADAAGANTGLLREILAAIQDGKVIAIDRTVLGRTAKGAILDAGRMGY